MTILIPRLFIVPAHLLLPDSAHNSWQAHVRLRRCIANSEYLQHGGVYYCRRNDVTVTSCIHCTEWYCYCFDVRHMFDGVCSLRTQAVMYAWPETARVATQNKFCSQFKVFKQILWYLLTYFLLSSALIC